MNIPAETLVGWAGTLVLVGVSFGVIKSQVNQNSAELENVWKWKNGHERDVVDAREKFQNQLSELKGASMVVNEQFKQIMAMFEEIKERLSILENHRNGGSK